jgi:hypothetical protein
MSMLPRLQPRCFTRPGGGSHHRAARPEVAWSTYLKNREIVRGGGQIVLEHAS